MQQTSVPFDDHTLVNQPFIKKVLSTDINLNPVTELPLHHGKYDGVIFLLYQFHCRHHNDDYILVILSELLCCCGDNILNGKESFRLDILSYSGICKLIDLLSQVLLQTPSKIYTKIKEDMLPNIMFVLSTFIQERCLYTMSKYDNANKVLATNTKDMEILIIKILCLPFAVDLDHSVFYELCCSIHKTNVLRSLILITKLDKIDINIVVGLIARLVLTDEMFSSQLKSLFAHNEILDIFKGILFNQENVNVLSDLLAVLSHLSRQSSDSVTMVTNLFMDDKGKKTFF